MTALTYVPRFRPSRAVDACSAAWCVRSVMLRGSAGVLGHVPVASSSRRCQQHARPAHQHLLKPRVAALVTLTKPADLLITLTARTQVARPAVVLHPSVSRTACPNSGKTQSTGAKTQYCLNYVSRHSPPAPSRAPCQAARVTTTRAIHRQSLQNRAILPCRGDKDHQPCSSDRCTDRDS